MKGKVLKMVKQSALLLGIACSTLLCFFSANVSAQSLPTAISKSNPLQQKVKFSVSEGENLVGAVQMLVQATQPGVNAVTLLSNDRYSANQNKVYVRGFTLVAKTYTLEEVLKSIKTVLPGLRWSSDSRHVNITIALSDKIPNPFEEGLEANVSLTQSVRDWLAWLGEHNEKSGILETPPGDIPNDFYYQIALPIYKHQAVIDLPQQTKLRVLMNSLADQSHSHWFATVREKNPIESYRVINGKRTLIRSEPGNLRGRTDVYFLPVFSNY